MNIKLKESKTNNCLIKMLKKLLTKKNSGILKIEN